MKSHIANTALIIISLAIVGCGGSNETVTTTTVDAGADINEQPSGNGDTVAIAGKSNIAPSINGTPNLTVQEGELYTFIPAATDEDNGSLTFSVVNKPTWISFDRMTGGLTGTPTASDVGVYTGILVSVSDGEATTQLNSFTISVITQNTAPSISGNPNLIVKEGENYTFTPTAEDDDNDSLSFSIENKPAWMGFDAMTGGLTGIPVTSDIGTYTGIIISVSDGRVTTQLNSFAVSVTNSVITQNTAPSISGNPNLIVKEGESYTFTPTAEDDDNDSLSFSIENKPAWMSFDAMTGRLSGTPVTSDVDVYYGIIISVFDGKATASLDSFDVLVKPTSATLSWIAPTTRADGSELFINEIAGYKIYMGSSTDNLSLKSDIADPSAETYKITSLSEGMYYFAITTYTTDGVESDRSVIVSKQI